MDGYCRYAEEIGEYLSYVRHTDTTFERYKNYETYPESGDAPLGMVLQTRTQD